jgi:hypothetical protein
MHELSAGRTRPPARSHVARTGGRLLKDVTRLRLAMRVYLGARCSRFASGTTVLPLPESCLSRATPERRPRLSAGELLGSTRLKIRADERLVPDHPGVVIRLDHDRGSRWSPRSGLIRSSQLTAEPRGTLRARAGGLQCPLPGGSAITPGSSTVPLRSNNTQVIRQSGNPWATPPAYFRLPLTYPPGGLLTM